MIAIPCVIYVADVHAPGPADEIRRVLDRNPVVLKEGFLKGELRPDWSREAYPVGDYETPPGPKLYNVVVTLKYHDPKLPEADDATPGDYPASVYANNSLEASELALDRFHETHPIADLDNADVSVAILFPEDCQHNWQTIKNQAVESCTVCLKCGLLKP